MAVIQEPVKTTVSMKLNNGVTEAGTIKTVSVSIGTINPEANDPDKANNIANSVSDCLEKSLVETQQTVTTKYMVD